MRRAVLLLCALGACAIGALLATVSALAQGPNVTGTWSAVYRCTSGYCAGQTFSETLTLTQTPGSSVISGTDNLGGSVTGTLSGSTLELTETDGGYVAYFTVTIAADGRSWSGTLSDTNATSGTDTATLAAPPVLAGGAPSILSSTSVSVSGSVNPNGVAASAQFEYGLDPQYAGGGPVVYNQSTPALSVPAGSAPQPVSATLTGLVPNALYHVRLVATSSSGTTDGPDQTFRTLADPAPPTPVLGKTVNATPVSGVVFIKLPGGRASDRLGHELDDALSKGQGFIPLTEARQIPSGSQIDARRGTLNLLAAPAAKHGKLERITLSGAIFATTQSATGLSKGLTTLSLLEGDFPGAPTYASCAKPASEHPTAQAAKASPKVLQTLKASDNHGHFATKGRYSSASVLGTEWTTSDRCDGTFTTVQRGTVDVYNFGTRKTVPVQAGHSYLAKAYGRSYS